MRVFTPTPLFKVCTLALLGLLSACNSGGGGESGTDITTGAPPSNPSVVTNATITANGPIQADGVSPAIVSVYLKNSKGQGVAGVTPTFSATNTGNSNVYGACTVSVSTGLSRCTLKSFSAETKALKLTSPIVVNGGSVIFHAGAVSAANSTITGSGPVTADGTDTSTITITLRDSSNNPAPGIVPNFLATDTGSTNDYGICSMTDADGEATCLLSSTTAETKTLAVTAPVSFSGGTVVFIPGSATAANSTITGTTLITADDTDTSAVTITLRDGGSNPVAGVVPTFTASGTANTASTCSMTDTNGEATCTLKSTKAEIKTLSIVTPVSKADGSVTFIAGAPASTHATVSGTSNIVANNVATSTITVYTADAYNNPVAGLVPTFSASGTMNTLGTCSAGDVSGQSTCTLKTTKAEIKNLAVVTPAAQTGSSVTFIAGPAVAVNSFITGTGPVVANNVATSTVTITLADAYSNLVQGVVPTFSATNTGTTNVYGTCSASDASGLSTCALSSLKAETKTLSIATPVVKADGVVVFEAGSAVAATSTITGSSTVTADGVATSTITVTLKDASANPVAGQTPTFTASGTNNTVGSCSATNASGQATCTLASTKAELKTLSIATPFIKADGSVTFVAGAPAVANSTITGTSPVVADGVATSFVTITLKDAFNNTVEGIDPTFDATDSDANNSYGTCATTNASGVSVCTLSSLKAETKTLSIQTPIVKAGGTVVFTPGSAVAINSSIAGSGPVVANGVATSTVTVTLQDASNNPVTGVTPTFSATGTGNTLSACSASDVSGISTCTLASTKAEIKTLSIATPFVKAGGTVSFTAGAAAVATSTITGTGPVIADGTATSTVTITLADANGNLISGTTPTFSVSGTGNTLSACSLTDASGESTCTLSSTKSEVKTLSIASPIVKADGTVTFTADVPVAANSSIAGTSPVTANGTATSTVTITLKDTNNNPVAGQVPTFEATDTGSTNTYGTCSATNTSGESSCTLASTKAETKILAIATPVVKAGASVVFEPGAAVAANSTITGTNTITANGVATSTVTITLKDASMNAVVGVTPTFSATDSGSSNSYGACSASNASGISTCSFTSTKAEIKTLAIATPVAKSDGTVTFIAGAASASTSTITGTSPVVADGSTTSTVTVTILDAFSNPIAASTPTFSATDTGSTNVYGACSATNTSGQASCTLSSTVSEVKTLSIATPISKAGGTVTFTAGTPVASNSTITGSGPVVANGSATSTVTITLRDASNNPVPGQTPTFGATDTGSSNVYGSCSVTNTSGVSSCTFTSTKAEIKTLAIATPVVKSDGSVTFTPGGASIANSTITGSGSVVADGSATSTVTITLKDANNNVISGITPTFSATGTGNTLSACSLTDASGESACTLASTKAETKTLSIATPIVKNDGTVIFTAGPVAVATSTVTGSGPITANGSSTSTVTVTLLDAFSNAVSGETPTFSATGSGNTLSACSASNSSGVATCTLASTIAEVKTLAIVTPIAKTGGTVTFSAGSPIAGNSSITGTSPVVADNTATSTVTITLKDANNNAVSGQTPTFSATGSGNTLSACSASNASGVSTCTLASTMAEVKTLALVTPVVKTGDDITFTAGAATIANSTITGSGPVVADGVATSTVTITLKDANNNAVVGSTPTFSATNTSSGNTYGTCSTSDASGVATCTLASTKAETKTLSIASPVVKTGGTVTFTAGSSSVANSTITGSGPIVANGVTTSTVTITLKDSTNNAIVGTTPTFSATGTGNSLAACSATNASGISTCTLTSTKAELKTLAIVTPVAKTDGSVTFIAGAASSATTTIVGTTPVEANGVATSFITITILDANSNPISGTTPIFNATNTGSTNTQGACSSSNASGISSCTLASLKAETKTLQLTSPTAVTGGTVVFTAAAPSTTTSSIAGTGPVTADGVATSTVTITLKDANNNPVPGQTPTFGATNTGTTNTYGTCTMGDTNGVSSCTLASTKAEIKTLSIATPIVKAGSTVTFNPGLPDATQSTITGSGPVLADGAADSIITITIKDAFGNVIAGETPDFDATGTGNSYDTCSVGNASGVSTCTMQSTVAEVKTLSITAPVTKTGGSVTFSAGGSSVANSTITGSGPTVANGTATSTVTVTLKDALNNAVSGVTPTFTTTGTGNTQTACSATNSSGISTCTVKSTKAEVKTLAIATPVVKTGGTVTFTPGAADATTSTITGTGPIGADGTSTSTITITIKDANANAISGTIPTFTATGTGNTLGVCSATNASGVATCTLASSVAETKTLAIATPVVKTDGTVVFQAGGAVAANSTLSATGPVTANGTSTSTVTITLKDNLNNAVAGVTPTFSATGTGNTLSACSSTNASGISTCTLASTKAEAKTLAIATPVVKAGNTITFEPGPVSSLTSTIVGTSPTLANGTDSAGITITLLDANSNPVSGSTPTFGASGTLNTVSTCTSSDTSGVSSCTLKSTKAEGKILSIVTPVAVTGPTIDFNPNGINLQVPIEMIDRGLIANTTATTYARSRTSVNTDDYVAQSNTYYFEIVAHNLNTTTAGTVSLIDSSGAEVADSIISVPANTSAANMTRYRVEFTPNDGADNYRIKLSATAATSQLYVHSAKIIIEQVAATDSKIYIPLLGFDTATDNASDTSGNVVSTTATTMTTSATYMSWWQRNDAVYDAITSTGTPWTFEAVLSSNNATATATVALYNKTTTTQVAAVTSTGTTGVVSKSVSFASNATNFTDGSQYTVYYRSSSTSYTTRVFKAGLWVKLKYLKKAEVLQRLAMRRSSTTATTNFFDNRLLWESAAWTNPTVFFQSVGYVTTSGIALYSVSNTDAGSAVMTAVTNGLITPDAAQSIKRTVGLTLVDNDRYFVRHTRTGGTAVMIGAFLVIRATE